MKDIFVAESWPLPWCTSLMHIRRMNWNGGGGSWDWQANEEARVMWWGWNENPRQPSSSQGFQTMHTPFSPSLQPDTHSCTWPNKITRCAFDEPVLVATLWSKEHTAYVLLSQDWCHVKSLMTFFLKAQNNHLACDQCWCSQPKVL